MVSCRQPLSSHIPPFDPRLLSKVSLHREPFIVSSCETLRHPTNVMAVLSRAPLNHTVALFITVLSRVRRSCKSFYPRCAWRAYKSFGWTRGTTPTRTPSKPQFVWFRSISLSDWVASECSHCSRCSTHQAPHIPLCPPPLSLPSPPALPPPAPPSIVVFLSLFLEGPLPPLGLPISYPLHSLSNSSRLRWPRSSVLQ